MKKTKNLLLIAIAITLAFIGCMKEKSITNESPEKKNSIETFATTQEGVARQISKGNTYHWRKSESEFQTELNAWKQSLLKESYISKGQCGTHISDFATLMGIDRDCNNNTVLMTYRVVSEDVQTNNWCEGTQTATFTNGFLTVPATLVNSWVDLGDPACTAWQYDGPCESTTTLEYQFNTLDPGPWTPGSILGQLNVQFYLGNVSICPLNSLSYQVQGGMSAAQYQASPARVYVDPIYYGGSVFIKTDCDLLCPPPQVICPGGGTFTYWPLSDPNNTTTLTLQPLNNVFHNFSSGDYGYTCTLWYNINGTVIYSQPQTGTFSVN